MLIDKKGPRFVISLGLVALSLGCFVIAGATDKWVFAIGFAGLCALGFGTIAAHTISTAVAREFVEKPGLPIGVATSGATAGQFLIVPLIAGVLTFASWRWVLRVWVWHRPHWSWAICGIHDAQSSCRSR